MSSEIWDYCPLCGQEKPGFDPITCCSKPKKLNNLSEVLDEVMRFMRETECTVHPEKTGQILPTVRIKSSE